MLNKNKILLAILVFFAAFSLATVFQISRSKADSSKNTRLWAWNANDDGFGNLTGIGWTSMNDMNCDTNGDTFSDEPFAGCPVNGAPVIKYGVNIPPSGDFSLTGNYAWNANVGWISFNAADLAGCPSAPCTARRSGPSLTDLKGWARIITLCDGNNDGTCSAGETNPNSGGWQGWIKLGSESGDPVAYGVDVTRMDGTGVNPTYAWSNELGWIDFSRSSIAVPKTVTATLGAVPTSCYAPCSSLNSTLTARITGGTATGDITYQFDCTNDGSYEATYTTANTTQTYSCTYTNMSNIARVRVTREGVTADFTSSPILVGLPRCGNSIVESGEACDDGDAGNGTCPATCSDSCGENTCQSSGNWKEVSP